MELPKLNYVNLDIRGWQGLNIQPGTLENGEMSDMVNMCADHYPYAAPRPSRKTVLSGIEEPQYIFSCNDKLGYIAGGKLYYRNDDEFEEKGEVGTVTSVVDFNGSVIAYPGNYAYNYTDDVFEGRTKNYLSVKDGEDRYVWDRNNIFSTFCTEDIELGEKNNISVQASNLSADKIVAQFKDSSGKETVKKQVELGDKIDVPEGAAYMYIIFCYGHTTHYVQDGHEENTPDSDLKYKYYSYCLGKTPRSRIWYEQSEYPAQGSVPPIKYACVDSNRIFGAEGNNVYASALGNRDEWVSFTVNGEPDPTGSYAETLNTTGEITGVVNYNNHVVMTKKDLVYEGYGNKPPYRIQEVSKVGCVDGRSIVEVNSVLYWLGREGIYYYAGGQPRNISEKIGEGFTKGVAGTDGRKYYVCLYDGERHRLFVYDTFTALWHIEDSQEYVGFAYCDGVMFALTAGGELIQFDCGDERVEWEFTTQNFYFDTAKKKCVSRLYVRVEMDPLSEMDVYSKVDNQPFERLAAFKAEGRRTFEFQVRVRKCDSFALKFKGIGKVKIMDVHAKIAARASRIKSGDSLNVFRY